MLGTAGEGAEVHSAEAPGIQEVWLQCRECCWKPGLKLRNWCWSCSVNPRAPSCGGSCVGRSCNLRIGLGSWGCWDCPAPHLQSVYPLALLWGFKHVLAGKAVLGNLAFFNRESRWPRDCLKLISHSVLCWKSERAGAWPWVPVLHWLWHQQHDDFWIHWGWEHTSSAEAVPAG